MKLNIVPASTGITWVKLGMQTFFKQPLALSGLLFMYFAGASALTLIPVVGLVLALALVPTATLGLMVAAKEASTGTFPMPTVFLSAFRVGRQQMRNMLVLGALYAGACMLVMLLTPLLVAVPEVAKGAVNPSQELVMNPAFQKYMLVGALLQLPVSLIFWHAPALVHWHGISPFKSLFFSIVACLRNGAAMVVYALGWFVVLFACVSVLTLAAVVTGSPQLAALMLMPVAVLFAAMVTTSFFFTFRDSFFEPKTFDSPLGDTP